MTEDKKNIKKDMIDDRTTDSDSSADVSKVDKDELESVSDNLDADKNISNSISDDSEDVKDDKSDSLDNENANCGLVATSDTPYVELISAFRETSRFIYPYRFNKE